MRAAVLHGIGEPLRIEELELDPPRAGEVSVRMLASGVCHSDVHRADGDWGEGSIHPIVLGHEGAGVVEALGEGVTGLDLGQLVALNWYYPCRACERCAQGREWLCTGSRSTEHLQMDGTTRIHTSSARDVLAYLSIGTFGERAVVPAQAAVPMPEGTPPEVAALIGCCVSTGIGAVVNTANLQAGAPAVIVGLGGVGLSAVMGAVLRGADPIVAVDLDSGKLELALDLGATHAVPGGDRESALHEIHQVTDGGAAFAFETAGAPAAAELAISSIGRGGMAVLVGLPATGARAAFEVFGVVDGSKQIVGSLYGWTVGARDFPLYAQLFLDGRLPLDRLVEERIGLADVNRAMDALRRGQGARRVVVFDQGLKQ
jgi:S-(hydroxymethyl)glutathione dehydrogenase/alcohol dehydrogenase